MHAPDMAALVPDETRPLRGAIGPDEAQEALSFSLCRGAPDPRPGTRWLRRLGGEEFGILIPGFSCDQGLEVARRICRALASRPVILDHQVAAQVSASLGLASAASSGYALRQLLIDADAALYRAKEGGRNQVVAHYSPDAGCKLRN